MQRRERAAQRRNKLKKRKTRDIARRNTFNFSIYSGVLLDARNPDFILTTTNSEEISQ